MEDEWKALGEEWGHPHPLAHRGLGLDEDLRAGDSISPSLGMPVDYMAQHRTGDYGGMRRSEQRSALPGGSEPFYNGRGQGNGAATFNGANGKEDTGQYLSDIKHVPCEGSTVSKRVSACKRPFVVPVLTN